MFSLPELHTCSDSIPQAADVTVNLMDLDNCGVIFSFIFFFYSSFADGNFFMCSFMSTGIVYDLIAITRDSIHAHSLKFTFLSTHARKNVG